MSDVIDHDDYSHDPLDCSTCLTYKYPPGQADPVRNLRESQNSSAERSEPVVTAPASPCLAVQLVRTWGLETIIALVAGAISFSFVGSAFSFVAGFGIAIAWCIMIRKWREPEQPYHDDDEPY